MTINIDEANNAKKKKYDKIINEPGEHQLNEF